MDKPAGRDYAGVRGVYRAFQDERISGRWPVRGGFHAGKVGGGQVQEAGKPRAGTTRSSRPSGRRP